MENEQKAVETTTPADLPQDLLQKVSATKAVATAHSLLGVGMFQHRHTEALQKSIDFLTSLHKQILEECLSHPDADKVPDLVEYKEEQRKQAELAKLVAEQKAAQQGE